MECEKFYKITKIFYAEYYSYSINAEKVTCSLR